MIICLIGACTAWGCSEANGPKSCLTRIDCEKNEICSNSICTPDPCKNGEKDAGESDIDCGGKCDRCEVGRACTDHTDCATQTCENSVCIDPESACSAPGQGDLLIAELYNAIKTNAQFDDMKSTQTEFIEIYNASGRDVSMSKLRVDCLRTDSDKGTVVSIPVNTAACLPANHALLLSYTPFDQNDLPEEILSIQALTKEGLFINTGAYACDLIWSDQSGDVTIHQATAPTPKNGVSDVLEPLSPDNTTLSHHDETSSNYTPGYCTNGTRYINGCQSTCDNGKKDDRETDIDCGGAVCEPCGADKTCSKDSDCTSNSCVDGLCAKVDCRTNESVCGSGFCDKNTGDCYRCDDGIQNGDETDVDCGGAVCAACGRGQSCSTDADCRTWQCDNGVCVGTEIVCETPQIGDLKIAEIFNYVSAKTPMSVYKTNGETQNQVEFIELYNATDHAIDLSKLSLQLTRTDNAKQESFSLPLQRCISAHQAVVISGSAIAGLPDDVMNIILLNESNALVNNAKYKAELIDQNETVIHSVTELESPQSQTSSALDLSNLNDNNVDSLVAHSSLNENLKHSPGYCSNGALYIDLCADTCTNNKKDNDETDVDCGGSCSPCGENMACLSDTDCEADLSCQANICQSDGCQTPQKGDLAISEVFNYIKKNETMQMFNTKSEQLQAEFIEIANLTDQKLRLSGMTLKLIKLSDNSEKSYPLSECIEPSNAAVITAADLNADDLPDGVLVIHPESFAASNAITNTQKYRYELLLNDTLIAAAADSDLPLERVSSVPENYSDTSDIVDLLPHNAVNENLSHSPGYCTNGALFTDKCVDTCNNNKKDGSETDVDCGGTCQPCDNDKNCTQGSDCRSGVCNADKCLAVVMFDLQADDLVINEIMGSPDTNKMFDTQPAAQQCEFVEIVNTTDKSASLSGISLQYGKSKDEASKYKTINLSDIGTLQAYGAIVLAENKCDIPVPDGVIFKAALPASSITNGEPYIFRLTDGTHQTTDVTRNGNSNTKTKGVSQNRNPDRSPLNPALVLHNTLDDSENTLANSPGYCANQKLFKNQCK